MNSLLRQELSPVPSPDGRIIIIVIIIGGDCINQHGRYYSTGLGEWEYFCTRICSEEYDVTEDMELNTLKGF